MPEVHVGPLEVMVDVKTGAVRAWVSKMVADDAGVPTIENAFGLLRQVLLAAVEDRRIPRNPCEGVRSPVVWCGARRRPGSAARCRSRRRWPTSSPR